MPVKKFRSIEEMDAARSDLWCDQPDAAYYERVRQLWDRSWRMNPRQWPRGVFKFRSIEEANAHRDQMLTEHIRSLRRRRGEGGSGSGV